MVLFLAFWNSFIWLSISLGELLNGVAVTKTIRLPRQICASVSYVTLVSGTHFVDVDIKSQVAGTDSSIHSSLLESWRVS